MNVCFLNTYLLASNKYCQFQENARSVVSIFLNHFKVISGKCNFNYTTKLPCFHFRPVTKITIYRILKKIF